jgi:hypothetical protein
MEDSFVIEWSASQKTFHLQRASEMFQRNLDCLICGRKNDFLPIFTFYSRHKAEKALEDLNKRVLADGTLNLGELRHVLMYIMSDA